MPLLFYDAHIRGLSSYYSARYCANNAILAKNTILAPLFRLYSCFIQSTSKARLRSARLTVKKYVPPATSARRYRMHSSLASKPIAPHFVGWGDEGTPRCIPSPPDVGVRTSPQPTALVVFLGIPQGLSQIFICCVRYRSAVMLMFSARSHISWSVPYWFFAFECLPRCRTRRGP
jgi:hypothetical protein